MAETADNVLRSANGVPAFYTYGADAQTLESNDQVLTSSMLFENLLERR
jgi:hypothetical protein